MITSFRDTLDNYNTSTEMEEIQRLYDNMWHYPQLQDIVREWYEEHLQTNGAHFTRDTWEEFHNRIMRLASELEVTTYKEGGDLPHVPSNWGEFKEMFHGFQIGSTVRPSTDFRDKLRDERAVRDQQWVAGFAKAAQRFVEDRVAGDFLLAGKDCTTRDADRKAADELESGRRWGLEEDMLAW